MAFTTIDNPELFHQTLLHAGNNSAFTFAGSENMQPDWIWNKNRDSAGYSHHMMDSVRGLNRLLRVDSTIAEFLVSQEDVVTSFNSDGFTVGADVNGYFASGSDKQVSWCWKAGTSFTNDASATSVGTIDSSGSVSDVSGFSICSFTGTGSNGTIKHGLSTAPRMIIFKQRNGTGYWLTYHAGIGAGTILRLDTNDAKSDSSVWFQNTDPTSSVFSVGTSSNNNGSSNTYIAYCFAEKKGYSKFGSYTGNGNADGTFVYTGFKPSLVIAKSSSASHDWIILDNKRSNPFNPVDGNLFPNNTDAEDTATKRFDFTSQGFKNKSAGTGANESGTTYIYMAFAESPFVTSTGVPNKAR